MTYLEELQELLDEIDEDQLPRLAEGLRQAIAREIEDNKIVSNLERDAAELSESFDLTASGKDD
jgi:hypothetical protein